MQNVLSVESRLRKSQGALTPAELKRMKNVPYASANLDDLHWTTVKNILKYLKNTKDLFLVYEGDIKQELRVSCYTDAEYLTDADDLKSQTRYVFVLNRGSYLGKEIHLWAWCCSLIEDPINMYCDNTGAITIANESGITKDDNLVDLFSKALAFPKHSEHSKNIGMLPASSLM
nr:hypothetical protein [Tanacetum cinerariifolium]